MDSKPTVSIIGGSGALGSGLAYRLAKAGYGVIIGSRRETKATEAAAALGAEITGSAIRGMTNRAAAESADLSILTVPFSQHDEVIEDIRGALAGKILVDSTVPLVPPRVARVTLPPGGSVALATQNALGQNVRVVSAFHNVAASHLRSDHVADRCDVLVFGNDKEARATVVRMAQDMGFVAWHAGAIDNSVVAEALTSVLIFLNKNYEIDGAGISITGNPARKS